MGDSLTPDLLSDMVKVLAVAPPAASNDDGWKVDLLRGLTSVRRFGMVVGFLDPTEKAGQYTRQVPRSSRWCSSKPAN